MTLRSHHKASIFLTICLVVLFTPGIGDYRWAGLMGFIYIGMPWYILALKDSVFEQSITDGPRFKIYSPTLFIFGCVSAALGVAIDLFILYLIFTEPNTTNLLAGLLRLLIGLPIFGFGAGLIWLSLGLGKNET